MKFKPGMKISNFQYNRHYFQPGMKIWYYARTNSLFIFKKIKMTPSQARFKWTDDKLINLIKCLQEFTSSMEFRNGESNTDKVKLHFFYQQRIFSTQPQCCLTFSWIEPKMLLKCCLLHIDMILQRHAIFCLFSSMSTYNSINYMIYFALSFSFSLQLII